MSIREYIHDATLLALAESGLRFIREFTEEGVDPDPKGFATLQEALEAARRDSLPCDVGFGSPVSFQTGVFELEEDSDGDWWTTYEDLT